MARISVSLPEEFIERLELVKDKINVSQVCREALERRITVFERVAANGIGDLDLDGLVGRLREERELVQGKFEDVARGNAVAWLSTTPYLEIKSVVEAQIPSSMDSYRLPRQAFRTMKQDMQEADVDCDGVHAVVYKTAWLDYVRTVWADIVDLLEDQTDHAQPTEAAV